MHDDSYFHPIAQPWWMLVGNFLVSHGHQTLIAIFSVLTIINLYREQWVPAFMFGAVVACILVNLYSVKVMRDIWRMEGRFEILRSYADARREGRNIDEWEATEWTTAIRTTQRHSHRREEL